MENAVRYTDEGGITIDVVEINGRCQIRVSDTGRGINKKDQNRIFEDFVQLKNRQRDKEHGVGLGLAIVRRISALLELNLQLESEPAVGTTFQFSLGIASTSLPDDQTNLQLVTANIGRGVRVWVVDDDEEVGDAMLTQLESWGCEVTLLSDWQGVNSTRIEQEAWPNLVLIDDMLSETDTGLDIARRLKEHFDEDRIILVTGNTLPERLDEIKDSDFTVLLKPTPTNQLKNLIVAAAKM